ncbi:MAG: hypothetical protein GKR89_36820 [Candidatus Latescibacteria bacterium]|nr:hypothetical protein [Candidatus Latescibacterota bacterium]
MRKVTSIKSSLYYRLGLVLIGVSASVLGILDPCWGVRLRYVETSKPLLLNPVNASISVSGMRISSLLYRGLIGQNSLGELSPDLAHDLPIFQPPDSSVVILKLKDGLRWPDGTPITAQDVVHSFALYRDERSNYTNANVYEPIDSVTVVGEPDGKTVRFKFNQVDKSSPARLSFYIVPAHLVGDDSYLPPTHAFNKNPVGAGPYLVETISDNEVVFTLNQQYFKPPPPFEAIHLQVNADDSNHARLLQADIYELDPVVRVKDLPALEANPIIKIKDYNTQSWYGFAYNCQHELLQYKEVRQALSMAFNKEMSFKSEFSSKGSLVSGPYTLSSFCFNPSVPNYQYNPSKVKEILEGVGFVDSDGNGYRDWDGDEIRFRIVLSRAMSQSDKDVCADFGKQLKALSIGVDFDWRDENSWYEKVVIRRDYDITFVSWKFDEGSNIYSLFSKETIGPGKNNIVQFENDLIESYLDDFLGSQDLSKRAEIGKQLHKLIRDEAPYNFLWTLNGNAAFNTEVLKNIEVHPFRFFTHIDEWVLEE